MPTSAPFIKLVAKSVLALLALSAIAQVAGHALWSHVSYAALFWRIAVIVPLLFIVMVACLIMNLQFRQWLLRHGATDTQWLWFASEPKGLQAQRDSPPLP